MSLGMASDLSAFGYFQRASVREMLLFTSRTIAQRTAPGQRQTVKQVCGAPGACGRAACMLLVRCVHAACALLARCLRTACKRCSPAVKP